LGKRFLISRLARGNFFGVTKPIELVENARAAKRIVSEDLV
jgi:hypothetical protein